MSDGTERKKQNKRKEKELQDTLNDPMVIKKAEKWAEIIDTIDEIMFSRGMVTLVAVFPSINKAESREDAITAHTVATFMRDDISLEIAQKFINDSVVARAVSEFNKMYTTPPSMSQEELVNQEGDSNDALSSPSLN